MQERFLSGLVRNVSAGTRLVLFLPVRWRHFRATPAQYVLLACFNLLVWMASDALQSGGGRFNPAALAAYLAQIPLLLLTCMAMARIHGRAGLVILLATVLSAGDLAFELAGLAVFAGGGSLRMQFAGWLAFLFWGWLAALRGVVVCLGFERRRTALSALLLAAVMALGALALPRDAFWTTDDGEVPSALLQEEVFHAQGELIEDSLDAVEAGREGVPELYFVGFAPDGSQAVFLHEMRSVKALMDARYATAPRSVVLVSNPATLEEFPLATATNLERALQRVGERMNRDEDVLFLYITAHGDAQFALSAYAPPLDLAVVNPTVLARALADAGIKWRVIVISACYAGGYIEALKDDDALIITAAASDRRSFGCENGNEWTYFGEAYFREALTRTRSFVEAFPLAAQLVAAREAGEKLSPSSNPQMYAGRSIVMKLRQLRSSPQ